MKPSRIIDGSCRALRVVPTRSIIVPTFYSAQLPGSRNMSSKSQPRILGREELKTDSKWLKLENIKWEDEDGKEVSHSRIPLLQN
jgi:hypothetical protein